MTQITGESRANECLVGKKNWQVFYLFFKWAIPGISFLYYNLFDTDSVQLIVNKICQGLYSKHRSLVLEVTALPTEPQPLLSLLLNLILVLY